MKRNLIKTALVAVFCFAAGYTAYNAQNKNKNLSDMMLNNVEALAWGEDSGIYYLRPCSSRPGAECSSTKYDEHNRCSYLTSC